MSSIRSTFRLFVFGSPSPPSFRFRAPVARRSARNGTAKVSVEELVAALTDGRVADSQRGAAEPALCNRLNRMTVEEFATNSSLIAVFENLMNPVLKALVPRQAEPQVCHQTSSSQCFNHLTHSNVFQR